MRTNIPKLFPVFSAELEGRKTWMYLDSKGLVTTGIGNLIDPMAMAVNLPWFNTKTNKPATKDEIVFEWRKMKLNTWLAEAGASAAKSIATLFLTDDNVNTLVSNKMLEMERFLRSEFPQWDKWPANAQCGVLSMSWAMGPGFVSTFKLFSEAARANQWQVCSEECSIDATYNVGLVPRNWINNNLFVAAALNQDVNDLSGLSQWYITPPTSDYLNTLFNRIFAEIKEVEL